MMKSFFYILSCILISCLLAFPCSAEQATDFTSTLYYFPSEPQKMKKDSGYSEIEEISINDIHFGWKIGEFLLSGFTHVITDTEDGKLVFLKTPGDEMSLFFRLDENINYLRGNEKISVDSDENGYDQFFQIPKTNFGQGALIIRHTDSQNKHKQPQVYLNFLAANAEQGANTEVKVLEEGDYEVALDYSIKEDISIKEKRVIPSISDYRVSFNFKVRNGNCMIYLFDINTGNQLPNRSIAPNGFRVDTANSKYLRIEVVKKVLDSNGLDLVLSPDFNKVVRDKQKFRDNGIYEISVRNLYTGAETSWTVYIGTDEVLKAYIVTGLEPREIQKKIEAGYQISEEGDLIAPTPTAVPTATFTPEPTAVPTATFTPEPTAVTQPENAAASQPTEITLPMGNLTLAKDFIWIAFVIAAVFIFILFSRKQNSKGQPIHSDVTPNENIETACNDSFKPNPLQEIALSDSESQKNENEPSNSDIQQEECKPADSEPQKDENEQLNSDIQQEEKEAE